MKIIVTLLILETMSLVILLLYIHKSNQANKFLSDTINTLSENNRKQKNLISTKEISDMNTKNTFDFVCKLEEKAHTPTEHHQRYFNIYESSLKESSQKIYAIFYEDNYIYQLEYLNGSDLHEHAALS